MCRSLPTFLHARCKILDCIVFLHTHTFSFPPRYFNELEEYENNYKWERLNRTLYIFFLVYKVSESRMYPELEQFLIISTRMCNAYLNSCLLVFSSVLILQPAATRRSGNRAGKNVRWSDYLKTFT